MQSRSKLRRAVGALLSRAVVAPRRSRYIFVLHDISDPGSPQHSPLYSTTPQVFVDQISFLRQHFDLVPLEQLVRQATGRRRQASICFDDGFQSVKEIAHPYLAERGIPFAVFINPLAVRDNRLQYSAEYAGLNRTYERQVFMGKEDLQFLRRQGVLIGNHSYSHAVLSQCDAAALDREIVQSKDFLEASVGTRIRHFALPYGKREHYNPAVLERCFSSGHDFVYSTNPAPFRPDRLPPSRPLIPRIGLTNQTSRELTFLINRPLIRKVDI